MDNWANPLGHFNLIHRNLKLLQMETKISIFNEYSNLFEKMSKAKAARTGSGEGCSMEIVDLRQTVYRNSCQSVRLAHY